MVTLENRRLSTEVSSVEAILSAGAESPPQPPPLERIGLSQTNSLMSPPPRPDPPRARPLSFTARNSNRISLSFPIQIPDSASSSRPTPTSSGPPSAILAPGQDFSADSSPQDANGFLVAIAAQERRVFELKEELGGAEADLLKLKRQWAIHETNKKILEIKHVEQLRPVQSITNIDLANSDTEDQSAVRRSSELDRRKALLAAAPKDSRRKIIRGGHTRTLSLLSPDRSKTGQYPPLSSASDAGSEHSDSNAGFPRSTTLPDRSEGISKNNANSVRHSYQGGATNGVKQIAEDLKAGLWTFMEDLRQAAVGDDAYKDVTNTYGPSTKPNIVSKKVSRGSLKCHNRNRSDVKGTPKSNALEAGSVNDKHLTKGILSSNPSGAAKSPRTPSVAGKKPTTIATTADLDDGWSNWDSPISIEPSPRWTVSTSSPADGSTNTRPTSRSKDADELMSKIISPAKADEIPWPALNSFTPANIKRTASALMRDFEKSLTPPPEDRKDSFSVAFGLTKTVNDAQH